MRIKRMRLFVAGVWGLGSHQRQRRLEVHSTRKLQAFFNIIECMYSSEQESFERRGVS